jgi:cyanate permease
MILLTIGAFLGLGYFYAFTNWIVAILATQGLNSDQAGYVGGILMLGGIFGAVIISALADRFGNRRPFLIGTMALGEITLVPLLKDDKFLRLLIWGFLHGFCFLPAYPLLLDMTSIEVGVELTGSATGIIQLSGNLGGVIMILSVGSLKGKGDTIPNAFVFLLSLIAAGFITACCLKPIRPVSQ